MATEKRLIDANECYERAWECYLAFYHHVADAAAGTAEGGWL